MSRAFTWWRATIRIFLVHDIVAYPSQAPNVGFAGGLVVDEARPCREIAIYLETKV